MKPADPRTLARKAREVSRTLRELSHPARLRILCRLCESPANVGELQEATGLEQAVTSQYLARLRTERRVKATRAGKNVIYEIADPRLADLIAAISRIFCEPRAKGASP